MKTTLIEYHNFCELYHFSLSNEYTYLSKNCQLLIIQVDSEISDANLLGIIVSNIKSAFPNSHISFNSNTQNKEQKIFLYFTFIELSDYYNNYPSYNIESQSNSSLNYDSLIQELKEKNRIIKIFNQQIFESLTYASKFQKTILPPKDLFYRLLPNHFVMYKPKDVVSGDFFWLHEINNKIYVSVGDCSGHGVTGALISIMGITLLNQIVNLFTINQTHTILNLLRDLFKKTTHQSEICSLRNDSIDIGLCIIDKDDLKISYSGAYMTLYVIRDNEFFEIKGNKMPIGNHVNDNKSFEQQTFQLQLHDKIYLATDGFQDQFGGKNNKKFMSKNFKNLLKTISNKSMDEQKYILKNTFELWKNGAEQIDDVTIIGFEIDSELQYNYFI